MKFGIIREGKVPADSRVPLSPQQCATLIREEGLDLCVQPSPGRCFPDADYQAVQVPLQENLTDRDILLGVKEVPVEMLIPNKTYLFFSHTIKAQPYNRDLLRSVLQKNIRLIDYEVLTNRQGRRLIAFGKFAGMVGAHNAIWTYLQRKALPTLPRMHHFHDYASAKQYYEEKLRLPPVKIVLTGTGRVGKGAALVLDDMGIKRISPREFLNGQHDQAVYTQLQVEDYVAPSGDQPFTAKAFYQHPDRFHSTFEPYTQRADIMINGIYWDPKAPAFFNREDMQNAQFRMQVIADVTCDIAPESSIPSTIRATTIPDPVYGFDTRTGKELPAFHKQGIDMMTIDNLPNELPRDASVAFGEQFIAHILPEFFRKESDILQRATIAANGRLGPQYQYLHTVLRGGLINRNGCQGPT